MRVRLLRNMLYDTIKIIMAKTKILIIIDQMQIGGAARVTSILLHELIENGYEVVLALDNINANVFYSIPKDVKQEYIPIKASMPIGLKQVKVIITARQIIRQVRPDVIIAVTFSPFFYAHYAAIGTGVPVIAYDHTSFGRKMGHFVNWIRYSLYGQADKLVILTEKDKHLLGEKFPRKTVVYNPLTYPIVRHVGIRNKTVLCVGRIDSWDVKGFDRIIDMWSHIAPKYPDWKLQIAGGGAEDKVAEIRKMSKDSGVDKQIEFLGQIYDMPALYAATSIFALPSRVEGFPMVLLEAMSQGCVCCTFEMGGAVNEMMNETSGAIVKDNELTDFERALEKLINLYPHYEDLQESGYKDAARFSGKNFYDQWNRIIQSVI